MKDKREIPEEEQNVSVQRKERRYGSWKAFFAGAGTVLVCFAAVYLITGFIWPPGSTNGPDSYLSSRKIRQVIKLIDQVYDGEIDEEKLAEGMYEGMIGGLGDRYSAYYTKEEYEAVRASQQGYYEGIGVTVTMENDIVTVTEVHDGTPAALAGLKAGDGIVRIDGADLTGKTLAEAVTMLKENGSDSVLLTLQREGEDALLEVEVKKEKLETESVAGTMLDDTVAYLAISEFTSLTPEQFRKVYGELGEQGMEKLIIDLRGNPGGLLTAVCDTLRQILPEGLIVYTTDKNGKRKEYSCDGETPISIPLVILVNGNTASAAEIFTGAVKDYELGTVVGEVTFGKGVVQNTYELPDGSVVKLTIAHYYTPLGNDIHGVGITPDVEVELLEDAASDVQLEKALEILRDQG